MPIDSINYFGLSDTINPFDGVPAPKNINQIYKIESFGNIGSGNVKTGLIPNPDGFVNSIIQVINPENGSIVSTLIPKLFTNIGGQGTPPAGECWLFNVDQFQSNLFVNSIYLESYLQINMLCDSCAIMGDWMNITTGNFLQIIALGQNQETPQGSWISCTGVPVNKYLYTKYNEWNIFNSYPYGKDINDNPLTPNLIKHALLGSGANKLNQASLGRLQDKSLILDMEKAHYDHTHSMGYFTDIRTGSGRNCTTTSFGGSVNIASSRSTPAGSWGRNGQFGQTVQGTSPINDFYMASGITTNDFIYSQLSSPPHYGVNYYIKVV